MKKQTNSTLHLVQMSLFSAIIIIMAFTPYIGYIPLGFTRATIIHVPVIIASIVIGPKYGAVLGALFGLTSLINNTVSPTATSFVFSPFLTVGDNSGNFWSLVICFLPRILVGVVPGYVYRGLKKVLKQRAGADTFSLIAAGLAGSLTNTLLVINMIFLFFGNQYAQANQVTGSVYGFIMGIIGINGVPEAIVAAILTLTICRALLWRKQNGG